MPCFVETGFQNHVAIVVRQVAPLVAEQSAFHVVWTRFQSLAACARWTSHFCLVFFANTFNEHLPEIDCTWSQTLLHWVHAAMLVQTSSQTHVARQVALFLSAKQRVFHVWTHFKTWAACMRWTAHFCSVFFANRFNEQLRGIDCTLRCFSVDGAILLRFLREVPETIWWDFANLVINPRVFHAAWTPFPSWAACVRWTAHYKGTPKPLLFEIDCPLFSWIDAAISWSNRFQTNYVR